eukprot:TRINITY_DN3100_c0_g1_i1.p1 TRINITY_DN3100_c0_g1~~TRINITY_DN3100_c0_g1_i1.p1  ORF type:complete len:384 (-),score=73.84 TRINITY_DN3100_c0_g1_i1:58-1209(-)
MCTQATILQRFVISDSTAPKIDVPRLASFTYAAASTINDYIYIEDDCSSTSYSFNDTIVVDGNTTGSCEADSEVSRVYTVCDSCGNCNNTVYNYTLTRYSYISPATANSACDVTPFPNLTGTAGSPAPNFTVSYVDGSDVVGDCTVDKIKRSFNRTWTVYDICGNKSFDQLINIIDDVAPVFTYSPPDYPSTCMNTPDFIFGRGGPAEAQDACGSANVTFSDSISGTCTNSRVITRTYTATDSCGNSATYNQVVTISNLDVTFTPPPATVAARNCTGNSALDHPLNETGSVSNVSHPCNDTGITVTHSDTPTTNDCRVPIIRTFFITDSCGAVLTFNQTINQVPPPSPPSPTTTGGGKQSSANSVSYSFVILLATLLIIVLLW